MRGTSTKINTHVCGEVVHFNFKTGLYYHSAIYRGDVYAHYKRILLKKDKSQFLTYNQLNCKGLIIRKKSTKLSHN